MSALDLVFDRAYYRSEYPDISLEEPLLLQHFCAHGWREGRNPNAQFDTVSYLLANDDVELADINPYFHYIVYGIGEQRAVVAATCPSVATQRLLGRSVVDWVEQIRPHLDIDYYRIQLRSATLGDLDLAAHFAYRGWRSGLSPNRYFHTPTALNMAPQCRVCLVNPLVHSLEAGLGAEVAEQATADETPDEIAALLKGNFEATPDELAFGMISGEQVSVVRSEFSSKFYLETYQDVASAGVDPLAHFMLEGWKEGRNPTPFFETSYYLALNPDVAASGHNPFWHYIARGRSEGRVPCRPGGHRRRTIDRALPPEFRIDLLGIALPEDRPTKGSIGVLLARWSAAPARVLALSHDCYIRSVGGTQIFIADEQRKFNAAGHAYLQISPQVPMLAFAPDHPGFAVRLVLDGQELGSMPLAELVGLLPPRPGPTRLVIHSLLGFSSNGVIKLAQALGAQESFFWLHDYASLCGGFNLLRNDVAFCHAPPPDSMACRVCVCGPGRPAHLAETRKVFEACRFNVLAPSQAALDLWQASTDLPVASARVHPHWKLAERPTAPGPRLLRQADATIAVAFVGYPLPSKGWPIFLDLVRHVSGDRRYRFLHFEASGRVRHPEITAVSTSVTPADRTATIAALRQHRVDLVMVLSTWPETFSFVAHEALLAGAALFCLSDSGNIAALVARTGRGMVFDTQADLLASFSDGRAQRLVVELGRRRLPDLLIDDAGTTATAISGAALPIAGVRHG